MTIQSLWELRQITIVFCVSDQILRKRRSLLRNSRELKCQLFQVPVENIWLCKKPLSFEGFIRQVKERQEDFSSSIFIGPQQNHYIPFLVACDLSLYLRNVKVLRGNIQSRFAPLEIFLMVVNVGYFLWIDEDFDDRSILGSDALSTWSHSANQVWEPPKNAAMCSRSHRSNKVSFFQSEQLKSRILLSPIAPIERGLRTFRQGQSIAIFEDGSGI
jgi:hypothetical protein